MVSEIGAQMSIAMMSAPSDASRTACARPWPRAAPVMKATLPSTRPVIDNSNSSVVEQFSRNQCGHGFPPADRRGLGRTCVRPVDLPRREPLEDFLERDSALETRQRVAHAEVRARPEGHVRVWFSMNVEHIAVRGEAAVVAVSGADKHQHRGTFRH